jgi:hypothetical protein
MGGMAMNVSRLKRQVAPLRALVACIATLALTMTVAGTAQANVEHHFCWGANIHGGGGSCGTADWYMNAAYTDSSEGPVCLYMSGNGSLYSCEKKATEGLYLNVGCYCYGKAAIFNWLGYTVKAYGIFWTE